jgi:hypothetical protein
MTPDPHTQHPSAPPELDRFDSQLEAYIQGSLSASELEHLEQRLLTDSDARAQFRRFLRLDANLTQMATTAGEDSATAPWKTAFQLPAPRETDSEPAPISRLSSIRPMRPLWAAAAGIVAGMLGASALWAYAAPTVLLAMENTAILFADSFESAATRLEPGFPKHPGIWSGDTSKVVESPAASAPSAGQPKARTGQRMLQLLRTDYPGENSPRSRSANQMLVLDVSQYQDWIGSGLARVDAQAAFQILKLEPGDSVSAGLDVFCYAEDPRERGQTSWQALREEHLGLAANRRPIKPGADRWELSKASLALPPETRFILIHLVVSNNRPGHASGGDSFKAAFVDDVSVHIRRTRKPVFTPNL